MNSPAMSKLHAENDDISLLLSPTKARLAAAESASWAHVDSRLRALFPPPAQVPRFERNEATLAALLALVKANEDADEERRIVSEATEETLKRAQRGDGDVNGKDGGVKVKEDLLSKLEGGLSREGKEALTDLAASAVLLACPTGRIEDLETQIMNLTRATFDAENEALRLQQTQKAFDREKTQLQTTLARVTAATDPEALKSEELQAQTQGMNRETKVVGMKLAEYQERIRALQNYDVGTVRTEDIVVKEKEIWNRGEEVKGLEAWILDMRGLPPDLDTSRKEVQRARNELEEWRRRRERAFEGLVE